MKRISYFILIPSFLMLTALKTDNPAYILYSGKGKEAKYENMVRDALKADIVLFGELHNNPVCHWLQLELTRDLFAEKGEKLILAAEMFESDNQLLLDEYISGKIRQKNFEDEAKLWKNYATDYKPLVEFSRENKISFIASNIPRRYAAMVNKGGFEALDSLSNEAKAMMAPLPIEYDPDLPGYKAMLDTTGSMGKSHISPNLPKAQASKDATMAYFILKNLSPGKLIVHFNGSYHSDKYDGIFWYLKRKNPELKILTISSVEQDTITHLKDENKSIADYVICIPTNMTKTY